MLAYFLIFAVFFETVALAMPIRTSALGACSSVSHYVEQFKNVLGESIYLKILVGNREKHLRVTKNNWSHDFTIVTRVIDKAEADRVYDYLYVRGFKSVDRFSPASFIDRALPLPTREGSLDATFHVKTSKNLKDLVVALSGRLVPPDELMPDQINSIESMRQWTFWKYFGYRSKRTAEEKRLLWSFRTAGYREIQNGLREDPNKVSERLNDRIETIDNQFIGNTIDRSLSFYHASINPALESAWVRLNEGEPLAVLPVDPAYTFTNLSKDFVVWWKDYRFKGKGIILDIQASERVRAVPMDRLEGEGAFLLEMSELEFVLPRGAHFIPKSVSTDADGNRIIHCEYE